MSPTSGGFPQSPGLLDHLLEHLLEVRGGVSAGCARVRCPECELEYLLPFSCKQRYLSAGGPAPRATSASLCYGPTGSPTRSWISACRTASPRAAQGVHHPQTDPPVCRTTLLPVRPLPPRRTAPRRRPRPDRLLRRGQRSTGSQARHRVGDPDLQLGPGIPTHTSSPPTACWGRTGGGGHPLPAHLDHPAPGSQTDRGSLPTRGARAAEGSRPAHRGRCGGDARVAP